MTTPVAYAVDLDLLAGTVDDLTACEQAFEALLGDLTAHVTRLHLTWTGDAAIAHAHAQSDWRRGFAAMHAGLGQMRGAARVAHDNYTAAVESNLRLWRLP